MKFSQFIGYYAAWQPVGKAAQSIVKQILDSKITGAARQATADSAMLHMLKYQGLMG